LCAAAICTRASADPVVTYTVTGTKGNYQLDFTIDNTSDYSIFDVCIPPSFIDPGPSGAPAGFVTSGANWQDVDAINDQGSGNLAPGATLSGFFAEDILDAVVPTSYVLTLQLSDNANDDDSGALRINEEVTANETVPDSGATIGLLAIAMGAMAGVSLLILRGRQNISLGS